MCTIIQYSVHLSFREAITGYGSSLLKALDTGWEGKKWQTRETFSRVYIKVSTDLTFFLKMPRARSAVFFPLTLYFVRIFWKSQLIILMSWEDNCILIFALKRPSWIISVKIKCQIQHSHYGALSFLKGGGGALRFSKDCKTS